MILHVDMDAFFASVEERARPELKGLPVVIGADPLNGKGRGVVSTCNYAARKFGVRSAMPISRAFRLCPHAAFLPVNYALYSQASQEVMAVLERHADRLEVGGVDEAYLDVTRSCKGSIESGAGLARKIQSEILSTLGLGCSIGVAPNKAVAKIASDFKKPLGLTVVKGESVESFLFPLPVGKIPGVGPKTEHRLNKLKVKTIADLADCNPKELEEEFGAWGYRFHELALGRDSEPVEERHLVKSIGREVTFQEDVSSREELLKELNGLASEAVTELVGNGFNFQTLTVKLRFKDFETHTKSKTFTHPIASIELARRWVPKLLDSLLKKKKKVRLVGFRVSGLVPGARQKTLLDADY
ncbi:MAG TPA: DNA polymerase IV [archaeon]|nr:DNA polymerase IV [archaeon]